MTDQIRKRQPKKAPENDHNVLTAAKLREMKKYMGKKRVKPPYYLFIHPLAAKAGVAAGVLYEVKNKYSFRVKSGIKVVVCNALE